VSTPPLPKPHPLRGFPKVTLESLYKYIESLEKMREERYVKLQIELESLEKRSEEIKVKLQIDLESLE
jgi:hypothetical protein